MSEVTSVNSKTGAVVLKAADVEAVPTSEIGQPSGVASLNGSGKLPEAQLMSSVEIGSLPPTGIAATDTATVKATLKAAGEATSGIAVFNKSGTYMIDEELVRPHNVSIVLGPATTFLAAAEFTGSALLSDSATEKSSRQSIAGGGTLDSNNNAKHALWCRYFGHITLGVVCQNSLEDDVILGDNVTPATAESYEPILTPAFWVNRTSGSVPTGHACLWAQNASDGRIFGSVFKGQETGIRCSTGNWKSYGAHPYGAGFPMQVCVEDYVNGNEWIGTNCDTPTPKEHPAAEGEASTSVITDPAILKNHEMRPVTGANIPTESFVGNVTEGVEFTLVNMKGEAVKPTGPVKGITLLGVALLFKSNHATVIGGEVSVSTTYGVNLGYCGIVAGPADNFSTIIRFFIKGEAGCEATKGIVGLTEKLTWIAIEQTHVATTIPQTQLPELSLPEKTLGGASITEGSIPESRLKNEAVTANKLGSEAVTPAKIKLPTTPTGEGENVVVLGERGVARKFVAALSGNGVATKFKVKHGMANEAVQTTILTEGFEQPATALGKVVAISGGEIEVTFTAAPAKGAIYYVVVVG